MRMIVTAIADTAPARYLAIFFPLLPSEVKSTDLFSMFPPISAPAAIAVFEERSEKARASMIPMSRRMAVRMDTTAHMIP